MPATASKPTTSLAGTAISIDGHGILLTGDAGTGKGQTALELISRGHRFIADDIVELHSDSEQCIAIQGTGEFAGFLHVRGLGLMDISSLYGSDAVSNHAPLVLVIKLSSDTESCTCEEGTLAAPYRYQAVLGQQIPTLSLHNSRPLSLLIETAVRSLVSQETQLHTIERFNAIQSGLMSKSREKTP